MRGSFLYLDFSANISLKSLESVGNLGHNRPMSFQLYVALRYLFSRRQTFIFIISLMSILGVALGVGALVLVLGVYNGMSTDLRDKILGANAHGIVLSHYSPALGERLPELLERIRGCPGVVDAMPFIYSEVMLSAGSGVKGVVLRGIDPGTAADVLTMLRPLSGALKSLPGSSPPGIIIGDDLARRLHLAVGARVNALSPSGARSTGGYQPRIKAFEVVGIFKTGMFEYDSSLAFIDMQAAREVLGLPETYLSGIEITVDDLFNADQTAIRLAESLGAPFYVRSWMEMNANIFAALKLEKIGMFILLTMVVLIGSFSIVTSLVMLVMEKTRDIAVMMAMGATPRMIRRIFIYQGCIIGLIGTALGYAFGLTLGFLLKKYQFIKLPENVYTLDHLPIIITMQDLIIIGVSAMLLCFLATLYPASQAARLLPADAMRFE